MLFRNIIVFMLILWNCNGVHAQCHSSIHVFEGNWDTNLGNLRILAALDGKAYGEYRYGCGDSTVVGSFIADGNAVYNEINSSCDYFLVGTWKEVVIGVSLHGKLFLTISGANLDIFTGKWEYSEGTEPGGEWNGKRHFNH